MRRDRRTEDIQNCPRTGQERAMVAGKETERFEKQPLCWGSLHPTRERPPLKGEYGKRDQGRVWEQNPGRMHFEKQEGT